MVEVKLAQLGIVYIYLKKWLFLESPSFNYFLLKTLQTLLDSDILQRGKLIFSLVK